MNLQTRVIGILTKPKEEWPVIAGEQTDLTALYKEYIAPLAAIPAICAFLGVSFLGSSLPFAGTVSIPLNGALTSLVSNYVLSLLGIYLTAMVVDKLAPGFQSTGGIVQALKMVAYSSTAIWAAGVFRAFRLPGILTLIAMAYSVYLFYLGLPHVMHTPSNRVVPLTIVSTVVLIVISTVMTSVAVVFTGVAQLF